MTEVEKLDAEEWRPVVTFDGRYKDSHEVSNLGRVRSRNRLMMNGGKLRRVAGRYLVIRPDHHGYASVQMTNDQVRLAKPVHTLVLEAFVGLRPEGMVARHLNGNRGDPRLENLAWGTPQENVNDQFRHGTFSQGEKHHQSRLTNAGVRDLREARAATLASYEDLGRKFGICSRSARAICIGKFRKDAPGPISPSGPRGVVRRQVNAARRLLDGRSA